MFWFQNITKHPCFVIRIACQPILKDPGLSVTVVLGFNVPRQNDWGWPMHQKARHLLCSFLTTVCTNKQTLVLSFMHKCISGPFRADKIINSHISYLVKTLVVISCFHHSSCMFCFFSSIYFIFSYFFPNIWIYKKRKKQRQWLP